MEVIYDLDTEALATAERARAAGPPGRHRRDRPAVRRRWCATCCSSGPPPSAARTSSGPPSGSLARCGTAARSAAAPTRAATAPGAVRRRLVTLGPRPAPTTRSSPYLAARGRPGPPPSWSGGRAARGHGRGHQVQRRRRGHRGRPGARGLIRTLLLERAPRRRGAWARRATTRPGTSGVRWIVDPIDGTVNFLYGLPQYAVSIAAELDGEVVAGVVLNVATGTEYAAYATRRAGPVATRDGDPIRVRGRGAAGRAAGRHRLLLRRRASARSRPRALVRPAAAGPRHPPARLVRARPVPRRPGLAGRLRRGGRQPLGPRRRRRWSPGRPGPRIEPTTGAGGRT